MRYYVEARIQLKKGVMDAEGETVQKSLQLLGFPVKKVDSVKVYGLEIDAKSGDDAKIKAEDMCKRLLANPVIQDYSISLQTD